VKRNKKGIEASQSLNPFDLLRGLLSASDETTFVN
jgi:hypothetical protein